MAPIVVTGIKIGISSHAKISDYPVRLEWSVFAKDHYKVTLYVKALEACMAMSQYITVPTSYFQIAGIRD